MKTTLHKANTRGIADHGWLKSQHSFSFANYFHPERMGFGALRVINDAQIEGGTGFGTHPHENMEIISVPLAGALHHKDTMGNDFVIREGEIQAMSAGTGIAHSEYNHSKVDLAKFLQIWVLPKKLNIEPQYSQKVFDEKMRKNDWQLIVSPDGSEGSVSINQDAYFSLVTLGADQGLDYEMKNPNNGVYFFQISGSSEVAGKVLTARDGLGVEQIEHPLYVKAKSSSEILAMEVPMK